MKHNTFMHIEAGAFGIVVPGCPGCESPRYYLKAEWQSERQQVTKEEFVRAERRAGFHNTMGQPLEPATGGFSGRGIEGWVEYL